MGARAEADQYIAGCIVLAAAPCTAMVFVWSHLTGGDAAYTLVQVAVNDLIMLVLFVPIVRLLVTGASSLDVPFGVLLWSVIVFIVIPLTAGTLLRSRLMAARGREWFEGTLMPRFAPVTIGALLATLVLIFAFQADNITNRFGHVLLIAVPITLQVYFNASLAYGLMKWLKVEHAVAAPGALIGASNFFELAVATAIALFGPDSGAALATVVGVLVEVPVMLSVCAVCNRTGALVPRKAGGLSAQRSDLVHRQLGAVADGGGPVPPRQARAPGRSTPPARSPPRCAPRRCAAMREIGIDIAASGRNRWTNIAGQGIRLRDHRVRPRERSMPGISGEDAAPALAI